MNFIPTEWAEGYICTFYKSIKVNFLLEKNTEGLYNTSGDPIA